MEIKKPAMAGTLESSDCMVTVEPGEDGIEFSLESAVIHQYGNQIRKVAMETLRNLGGQRAAIHRRQRRPGLHHPRTHRGCRLPRCGSNEQSALGRCYADYHPGLAGSGCAAPENLR